MTVRFENLTSQITGANDTFILSKPFSLGTVSLGYNGQLYPVGVNIQEEIQPSTIKLSFTPSADTDTLLAIYDDGEGYILMASAMPPRSTIG